MVAGTQRLQCYERGGKSRNVNLKKNTLKMYTGSIIKEGLISSKHEVLRRTEQRKMEHKRSAAQIPEPTPLDSKSLDASGYKLNHSNKLCHGIKHCTTQA